MTVDARTMPDPLDLGLTGSPVEGLAARRARRATGRGRRRRRVPVPGATPTSSPSVWPTLRRARRSWSSSGGVRRSGSSSARHPRRGRGCQADRRSDPRRRAAPSTARPAPGQLDRGNVPGTAGDGHPGDAPAGARRATRAGRRAPTGPTARGGWPGAGRHGVLEQTYSMGRGPSGTWPPRRVGPG